MPETSSCRSKIEYRRMPDLILSFQPERASQSSSTLVIPSPFGSPGSSRGSLRTGSAEESPTYDNRDLSTRLRLGRNDILVRTVPAIAGMTGDGKNDDGL